MQRLDPYKNFKFRLVVGNDAYSGSLSSWASRVAAYGSSLGAQVSPKSVRKSVILELYDEAGALVVRYMIDGPKVSETPMSPPRAAHQHVLTMTGAASIKQLTTILENSLRRLRP